MLLAQALCALRRLLQPRSPAASQSRSGQRRLRGAQEPGAEQTTPGSAAPKPTAPLARRKPGPAASEGELSLSVCL